jgi:hypothetical protein
MKLSFALLCLAAVPLARAQSAGVKPSGQPPDITAAWDQIVTTAVLAAPADPALSQPQATPRLSGLDDFFAHFFFESRTNYERYQTNFTGNPTTAGVINAPITGFFNPAGIPSPVSFEPGSNRIATLFDFGTRGYGSDRINTHFAVSYRQDLTHTGIGSPAENVVETFGSNRLFEILDANIEINSKPTDGIFRGTSLELGRLNVYGAELASLDGASFTLNRPKFDFTLYGGRRFSYFSDPEQRGIGGANLNLKINPSLSVELETLAYIRVSNKIIVRKRFSSRLLASAYLRSYGGSPVDFDASALYSSRNGRDTIRAGFFQKLTNSDYSYDYTIGATDQASKNSLLRLYLGPIAQYSQFNVEAHRQISRRLRAGGAVVVRRLNDKSDEGPFDTSFEDYKFNGQFFPFRGIETFFEYHQRNSDRLSPLNATTLDDLSATGETSVKDLTGEISRSFGEGRFHLSGGVYYRRISMQDSFYYLTNLHQSGVLGSAWVRIDRHSRVYFDYSLDNDFFLLQPDIKNSQVLRLGVAWKY